MVATDVDGTLTRGRKLGADVVAAVSRLSRAGIVVVPVSGRPAGEVLGLCRYLPGVSYGIAENGQVAVLPDHAPRLLVPSADRTELRALALAAARGLGLELRTTADDPFRVVDVAFEREDRPPEVLRELARELQGRGLHTIWSSVHVHVSAAAPDKGAGLLQLAAELGVDPGATLTLGDAPNDAGLFRSGCFAATVGTRDILHQLADLPQAPRWVTRGGEAEGFLEVAAGLAPPSPAG
jgi:hypothetical protein